MSTMATPSPVGILAKNRLSDLSPPAEVPMPTTTMGQFFSPVRSPAAAESSFPGLCLCLFLFIILSGGSLGNLYIETRRIHRLPQGAIYQLYINAPPKG